MEITRQYETFDIRMGAIPRAFRQHCGHQSQPRTTGVWHVSTIIKHGAVLRGLLNETDLDKDIDTVNRAMAEQDEYGKSELLTRIAMGLAWEEWLAYQLSQADPAFQYHPGEYTADGIYMSPDAVALPHPHVRWQPGAQWQPVVHEFKLTWGEAGTPIDEKWYWLTQIKCYCHALGTTNAVLHVAHVNGYLRTNNNKRTRAAMPVGFKYHLQFTEEEIQATWKSILTTRKMMESDGMLPE